MRSLGTRDTLKRVRIRWLRGLEVMRVDIVKPQKIVFFTPVGHGVMVLLQAD